MKYGITPANVLISLQLSVSLSPFLLWDHSLWIELTSKEGHSVLPKSVTPSRITENLKVVQLSEEDLQSLYKAFEGMRHRYCDFSEISMSMISSVDQADKVVGYKYYEGLDDSD